MYASAQTTEGFVEAKSFGPRLSNGPFGDSVDGDGKRTQCRVLQIQNIQTATCKRKQQAIDCLASAVQIASAAGCTRRLLSPVTTFYDRRTLGFNCDELDWCGRWRNRRACRHLSWRCRRVLCCDCCRCRCSGTGCGCHALDLECIQCNCTTYCINPQRM